MLLSHVSCGRLVPSFTQRQRSLHLSMRARRPPTCSDGRPIRTTQLSRRNTHSSGITTPTHFPLSSTPTSNTCTPQLHYPNTQMLESPSPFMNIGSAFRILGRHMEIRRTDNIGSIYRHLDNHPTMPTPSRCCHFARHWPQNTTR